MQYHWAMKTSEIKAKLEALTTAQMKRLAELSDLHERTLWAIRMGDTGHASEVTREKLSHGFRHMPRNRPKKEGGEK